MNLIKYKNISTNMPFDTFGNGIFFDHFESISNADWFQGGLSK